MEANLVDSILENCVAGLAFIGTLPSLPVAEIYKVLSSLQDIRCLPLSDLNDDDATVLDANRSRAMIDAACATLHATCALLREQPGGEESSSDMHDVIESRDAVDRPIARSRSSSSPSSSRDSATDADELDSFASSRRRAIEATVVDDNATLPRMADIVGNEKVKTTLMEAAADPILYPEWFAQSDLRPLRTILLYGPPGTGKSHLARAVAREIDGRLFALSSGDLISSWSGQSERLIRALFDAALRTANADRRTPVVFIDEIDSLCRTRSAHEDDANRRVKTELLVQLQRLNEPSALHCVLLAATNCPWDLDAAFLRRFEKRLFVGLPEAESRIELLRRSLANTSVVAGFDWNATAALTDGFSGDDLRRFAREIAAQQFRRFKSVSLEDMRAVADDFMTTVNEQMLKRYVLYSQGE